ncbi:hypothetical protein A2J03_10730 [Rhodococcus sp. EPR-157]|nr:hypothetical protein A2J03_10730 [Rhodococcus sp. EPR-157]
MRKPTMRDRRQVLNRVTRYLDGTPLLDATAKQLDDWQLTLQEKSPQTVCTYTTHIQQFYVWALDEQLIVNDPARRLPKPKLRRRLPRPMDEDDMKRALNAARSLAIVTGSARIFVWLLLAGYCGLRAGEISRLKGSDFRRSEDGGAWLSVDGKGGYPRVVRVAPDLFVYVKPFLDKARRGPLFPTEKGAALSPNEVSKRTNAFLHDTVGIDDTFHSLRHRFATSLADLGADIRDVQAALGHASLNTTSLYLASNTRRGAASVDALAADLDGDLR